MHIHIKLRLSSTSFINQMSLFSDKSLDNIAWNFQLVRQSVYQVFQLQLIIQHIVIKVSKLWGIPFRRWASKKHGSIDPIKKRPLKVIKGLEVLYKKYYIYIINAFAKPNYLVFAIRFIEIGVEIFKTGLILFLGDFWQTIC